MEMENIQNLLEKVDLLITKNDELLDATGARFNMFKVCRVDHYENTHSAIITEFLKPNGSHGMGSLFLKAFLEILPQNDDLPDDDFKIRAENCNVRTEVSAGNGRMDILITDGTYAICIENKIYAKDQYEQLQRYEAYLEKEYKGHWKIYYLTLGGYNASDDSADGVTYTPISHSTDIVNWLEKCIKIAAEKPMLRETLCQYRNHIKKLTGTNMEKKCMEDLIKLISGDFKNYSSALEITKMFWQVKKAIFEKFLKKLEKFVQKNLEDDKEIKFFSTASPKKYSCFGFCNPSWNFKIHFEFQDSNYNNLIFGITIKKDFKDKIVHIARKFEHEEFINKFEAREWSLYKNVQKLLWDDDICEKIMIEEKNGEEELLGRYETELEKIFPFIKQCIEFQNSTSKT